MLKASLVQIQKNNYLKKTKLKKILTIEIRLRSIDKTV